MADLKTVLNEVFENSDLNPMDFIININEWDDDLEGLKEYLEDASGFIIDNDIIYYSEAIEYLSEHDNSLQDSLNLAIEFGYTIEKLNSELLATLLYQKNLSEEFEELWEQVESRMEA